MSVKYFFKAEKMLFILFLYLLSCTEEKKVAFQKKDWVSLAIQSEKYIQTGKYLSDKGESWRIMPDSLNSEADNTLYSGNPGIVLFYLELFYATQDSTYLKYATSGANYLINTFRDTIYTPEKVGLYTGLAGIGYTLTEVFKITKDQKYRNAALQTVDLLDRSADRTSNGIQWGGINDIVYGSAGIGLSLQYIADQFKSKKADLLSISAAEGLLSSAIKTKEGLRWKFSPEDGRFLDNFSHGTSGIAYFLAQTYKRTQEKKYLDAAIKAADFLSTISNHKGYIPHHLPGGEDLYYLSWCHGPAGTSRLYYALFEITKEKSWLEKITHSANQMISEGIDQKETLGYWNNQGKCCGTAGIAEYYLWLYHITANQAYLKFSEKMTQKIIDGSIHEQDHIKWIHAEHRVRPDYVAAQTGLMQGSAGIGLWFLQINAYQQQQKPLILLPDKSDVFLQK